MAAPKTVITFDLDGSNRDFEVPFEYLARKFVVVTLVGTDRRVLALSTDYRFAQRTIITTTQSWGPADGYERIEIRRVTSATERLVDFSDGSVLRAYDLNISNVQSLHIAEEGRDIATDTIGVDNDGNLDARGRKIVNLADAVEPGDAVTLRQEQEWAQSTLGNAQSSAISAAASQQSKEVAVAQAILAQGAASRAKDEADKAGASEILAKAWAVNPVDVPVVPGEFSAKHWGTKAVSASISAQTDASTATSKAAVATTQAGIATTEANRARDEAAKVDTARMRQMLITSAEIKAGFEAGGPQVVKNGGYYMLEPCFIDYGDGRIGFLGNPSPRQKFIGEVRGGTIFSVQHSGWAFQSVGPAPFTYATGGDDEFGNFTIVGPNVAGGAGAVGQGKGLRVANRANTYIHDMSLINLEQGLHLDGVLTSEVSRVNITGCAKPSIINTTDLTSSPNAVLMNHIRVANSVTDGIISECGAAMAWQNLTIEGNGQAGSGHSAFSMYSSHAPFAGITRIASSYAELNGGSSDMYFENKTNAPMVIVIDSSIFARVGTMSDLKYVDSHIVANCTGSGTLDIYVNNPLFIEGFGYESAVGRPITRSLTSKARIHLVNPHFLIGSLTNVPLSHSASATFVMHVEEGGGLYAPPGWSIIRTPGGAAIGDFLITRDTPIARNVYQYVVNGSHSVHSAYPDSGDNAVVRLRRLTESQFRLRTFTTAGAPVAAGVDLSIHTM